MSTKDCNECKHFDDTFMKCHKGHNPQFHLPKDEMDLDWGWKGDCDDFEQRQEVNQVDTPCYMEIERLKDEAAMFLEEMHVSGDAMVDMDHCLDELSEEKQGAYYLHDLMALFCEQRQKVVLHDTFVALLHKEAEKFEKQGLTHGKIGNTHTMHGKMDTARCFRLVANTLSGDQAG